MAASLRPGNADDLGLRRALSDRLLPLLVGAMVFLAALTLAGAFGSASLASRWQTGAASILVVSVPEPDATAEGTTRAGAVARAIAAAPGITSSRRIADTEVLSLLKPWLGDDAASLGLHLPAIFEVRVTQGGADPGLAMRLDRAAPGTVTDNAAQWLARMLELVRSLEACAAVALMVVTLVAAAIVCAATRAGLAAGRDAIEIVHGLGATDGAIAGKFARRAGILALVGALLGATLAVPVLLTLARLAAPFLSARAQAEATDGPLPSLPPLLWAMLACLPVGAAVIGWATAQVTVHGWLRRLP
jgi:cell division transport system permease protein